MRVLASVTVLALATASARAQTGRPALVAGMERYLLADYQGALPLLGRGLDPAAGPVDSLWLSAVERLTDVLLVLRQDTLAAAWLRWAIRLAPGLAVDEEVMPPIVVRAAAAARAFVDSTPRDRFVARVEFRWPAATRGGTFGTVRLAEADVPITARVGADQFLRGGEIRRLTPGSYGVVVSAPGYLPTRLTVEVLPDVTTEVAVNLLPETAGLLYVAARPWGTVWVDSQLVGYTPVAGHRVAPGSHAIRFVREGGGGTTDTAVVVADRQQVHLSWTTRTDTTGEPALDRALALLDVGDLERGVRALDPVLRGDGTSLPVPARVRATARLADARWALGDRDSALAYLHDLVRLDPFYLPPTDLFNPDLWTAYAKVRRGSPVIAIRAPADTVLTPVREAWPVEIAVGQPGEVRLVLRLTTPRPHDSVLTSLFVEALATARIILAGHDGRALEPGSYGLEGEVVLSGETASDLLQLVIEQLPVDTTPRPPPLPLPSFRPETSKGLPSLRAIANGVGLGLLAVGLAAAVNDRDLTGRSIPLAAALTGGAVAAASIGFSGPAVPIPANVDYNHALRAAWQERDRAISAANALRLNQAPLRLRAVREP